MADIRTDYTLTIDQDEAVALKRLLGSMNDVQFGELGISDEDRVRMAGIYDLLPYGPEEA